MLRFSPRRAAGRAVFGRLAATALLVALGWAVPGVRADVPEFPLERLVPGMRGVVVTVLQGSTPDTLPVEVVGTYPGYSPRSQVVLVRGQERLAELGIAHGMSGSPVYVDGQLVGALAFAFSGAREPIAGVTPIGEMVRDLTPYFAAGARRDLDATPGAPRPLRPDLPSFPEWRARCARGEFGTLDAASIQGMGDAPTGLVPIGLPVAVDGLGPAVPAWLEAAMRRVGLTPVSRGGAAPAAGASAGGPQEPAGSAATIRPGESAAVTLVSGDMSAAAIGTVTWVEGDRVYAFGHPFLFTGETQLPFARARIAAVIPTLDVSFKIGTPGEEIGVLVGDKRTGVAAKLGSERAARVSLDVSIAEPGGADEFRTYHYEVARHEQLTSVLLAGAAASALAGERYGQGTSTLQAQTAVDLADGRRLERRDIFLTLNPSLTVAGEVLAPATYLLESAFERYPVKGVHVKLALESQLRAEQIEGVRVLAAQVRPGEDLPVEVRVREYLGQWRTRRVTLHVPAEVPARDLLVLAGSPTAYYEWDQDRAPDKYRPQTLDDLVRLIETYPTEESLIVRLYGPSRGVVHRGHELSSLPPSKWHALSAGTTGGETTAVSGVVLDECVVLTGSVVLGGTYVQVRVSD